MVTGLYVYFDLSISYFFQQVVRILITVRSERRAGQRKRATDHRAQWARGARNTRTSLIMGHPPTYNLQETNRNYQSKHQHLMINSYIIKWSQRSGTTPDIPEIVCGLFLLYRNKNINTPFKHTCCLLCWGSGSVNHRCGMY